jgi:hypothetical protein
VFVETFLFNDQRKFKRGPWTTDRGAGGAPGRHNPSMFFNLPTLFTWARIVANPLVVGVYYINLPRETQNIVGTALFILFALTDWAMATWPAS